MTPDEVLNEFRAAGALLEGHFILTSGLRSPVFLQKAFVFQNPARTERLCQALALKARAAFGPIDVVVSPAVGGIIPGYETARHLGAKAIFVERESGKFALRRGFDIAPEARVLIVEDIVTTGLSSRETLEAIRAQPGMIVGAACLIDRSGGKADLGVPLVALATLDIPSYSPDRLPPELAAMQAVKPGKWGTLAMSAPLRLGVNIDHVATVRNARGGAWPDPVRAALVAIDAGADGITAHLREDRRHIVDDDIARLMQQISKPLNLEMAATDEMLVIALRVQPHAACLVPEKRTERTTEGGLDVVAAHDRLKAVTADLAAAGIRVSLFIEPAMAGLDAAVSIGAPVVELHTGAWCDALASNEGERANYEFGRLRVAAAYAAERGLECHAGHGLDFQTARRIAELPQIVELNIGHFLVGEAIFSGFATAIQNMRAAMDEGRRHAG